MYYSNTVYDPVNVVCTEVAKNICGDYWVVLCSSCMRLDLVQKVVVIEVV